MKSNPQFAIRSRQEMEKLEEKLLTPYATKSRGAHNTRQFEEPEHAYRTAFQRDRDRIIHSRAFRRLKHKRQVFLTSVGDHYRTRITHTLEVAQLSRTLVRALGLNEDLVEAIALGHDLGHTPFGHLGEVILNQIMIGAQKFESQEETRNFGGFKHNYQSLRVVDYLEKKYAFNGLNLTAAVREGILKHTRLKKGRFEFPNFYSEGLQFEREFATTLEGQVVAICDEVAQRTHDLEDGIRAGLVELQQVREVKIVQYIEKKIEIQDLVEKNTFLYRGLLIRALINLLIDDIIHQTLKNLSDYFRRQGRLQDFDEEIVYFSPKINPLQKELNKFIHKEIIEYSRINWGDELGKKLLCRLFEAYLLEPKLLPDYVLERYFQEKSERYSTELLSNSNKVLEMQKDGKYFRTICDYIAGMTDNFAVHEAERLSRIGKIQTYDLRLDFALGKNLANGEISGKYFKEFYK
ncbi:MAG: dGTP triphosphohydrolase [bacterium]